MDEMDIVRKVTHIFYMFRKENASIPKNDEFELSHRDIMMLDAVSKINQGEPVKMGDLSTHFQITPAAISQIIKSFEKKDWIERIILENDRRSVYIKVTPKAHEIIENCEKRMINKLVAFIESLGKEDSEAFVRILEKAMVFSKESNKKDGL